MPPLFTRPSRPRLLEGGGAGGPQFDARSAAGTAPLHGEVTWQPPSVKTAMERLEADARTPKVPAPARILDIARALAAERSTELTALLNTALAARRDAIAAAVEIRKIAGVPPKSAFDTEPPAQAFARFDRDSRNGKTGEV